MAVDMTKLNQTIDALTSEVTQTEGRTDSAVALLRGQADAIKAAVATALADDDAADQGSIETANAAIEQVAQRFAAAGSKLADAIAANPGTGDGGTGGGGGPVPESRRR